MIVAGLPENCKHELKVILVIPAIMMQCFGFEMENSALISFAV